MSHHLLWIGTVGIVALSLSDCLSSSDSTGEARDRPNTFPPLQNDFTETSSGDANVCRKLESNEVCVTVEVPRALAHPGAEESRRNLYVTSPQSIEVMQLGSGLRQVDSLTISQRETEQGSTIIALEDFKSIPSDPDYIVKATLPGGAVVQGPLSDSDQDIKLNPFSEYLVSETLFKLGTAELQAIKQCDASNNICLNQLVWPALVDQIQDFEIRIPDGMGLIESVDYLATRADLTGYVDDMVDTLQVPDERTDEVAGHSIDFNTVYFGLELNSRTLEDGGTAGQWGIRRATTGKMVGNGGTAEVYPTLTLATFNVLGLAASSIAGQVPYGHQTLTQSGSDMFSDQEWAPNLYETAPGVAFIRDGRFLEAGRTVFQSVTRESDGYLWGWAPNPYFFNSYILPDGEGIPKGLLASYFQSGKALKLGQPKDGKYQRFGTLADLAIGALEVSLRQLESEQKDTPFNLSVLDGVYNEVSLSVELDASASNPVAARIQAGQWESNGPNSDRAVFVETSDSAWVVHRTEAGTTTGLQPESVSNKITLENEPDEIYLGTANPKASAYYGRLNVSGTGHQGTGAGLQGGDFIAYTYADASRGAGIKLAARDTSSNLAVGATYLLQGFTLGMTDEINRLEHFSESSLTIQSATEASLSLNPVRVTHTLQDRAVSEPRRPGARTLSGTITEQTGSRITMEFPSEALTLEGFLAQGGDLLVLTARDSDDGSVGLVLGYKD